MLAPEPILLEHRFPNIGRIADVFYPSRQIIFEVQVSPISIEEIRARNKDYASLGYDVIWILHDRQFNRVRATSAETFLATSPHYFTNINRFGKGFFYDQYSLIRFKRRLRRTPRFPVRFKRIYSLKDKQLPSQLPKERKKWSLSVEGDLFNRSFHWEQEKISLHPLKFFARFYTFLLNLFLEKTSG
jgi:competence protein CoiA